MDIDIDLTDKSAAFNPNVDDIVTLTLTKKQAAFVRFMASHFNDDGVRVDGISAYDVWRKLPSATMQGVRDEVKIDGSRIVAKAKPLPNFPGQTFRGKITRHGQSHTGVIFVMRSGSTGQTFYVGEKSVAGYTRHDAQYVTAL